MRPKKRNTPKPPNAFFIGGLLGAGVGYLSALFLAKQEGEKTQKELKIKGQEVSYKALSELEKQLDQLQGQLTEKGDGQAGKPSRINVDVKEKYEGRRSEPDIELEMQLPEEEV